MDRRRLMMTKVEDNTDWSQEYFTLEILPGSGHLLRGYYSQSTNIEYSIDKGPWLTLPSTLAISTTKTIHVRLKGANNMLKSVAGVDSTNPVIMVDGLYINIMGNLSSLIYGDDYLTTIYRSKDKRFKYAFTGLNVVSAENLIMPQCLNTQNLEYEAMFWGCDLLIKPPTVLPATTLYPRCYADMFYGCNSLLYAPLIQGTIFQNGCCSSMFSYCTSLISVPSFTVEYVEDSAFQMTFYHCESLSQCPIILSTTILAKLCYHIMFGSCYALTTAPELPATTLAESCYKNMFSGCSSLNYIKCLAVDISASGCLEDWVKNVSSTGTFIKSTSQTSLPNGDNGIPLGWTVQNA